VTYEYELMLGLTLSLYCKPYQFISFQLRRSVRALT